MSQEVYRTCMSKNMGGGRLKGLGKEERKIEFCIIAKQCSKDIPREEAAKLCDEAARNPKPKKESSKKTKFCSIRDMDSVAACITENIDIHSLTQDNMHQVFSDALKKCSGGAALRVKQAKKQMEDLTPKQLEALQTMSKLQKQFEGKLW